MGRPGVALAAHGAAVRGGILPINRVVVIRTVIAQQRPLPFHGAGDAGGDGVEQALEFGLGRCGDVVETGLFVIERVGAIDEEHVQVDVGSAPSRIAG